MDLVNEWFPYGKFINIDTPFHTYSTYEKKIIAEVPLTGNSLQKEEKKYHGKFGHTLGRIKKIATMSIIDTCYIEFFLRTQTVTPTLPGFQCLKR